MCKDFLRKYTPSISKTVRYRQSYIVANGLGDNSISLPFFTIKWFSLFSHVSILDCPTFLYIHVFENKQHQQATQNRFSNLSIKTTTLQHVNDSGNDVRYFSSLYSYTTLLESNPYFLHNSHLLLSGSNRMILSETYQKNNRNETSTTPSCSGPLPPQKIKGHSVSKTPKHFCYKYIFKKRVFEICS